MTPDHYFVAVLFAVLFAFGTSVSFVAGIIHLDKAELAQSSAKGARHLEMACFCALALAFCIAGEATIIAYWGEL